MDAADLEGYEYQVSLFALFALEVVAMRGKRVLIAGVCCILLFAQLAQVTQASAQDPSNAELKTLKGELEDLIALTKDLIKQSSGGSSGAPAASEAGPSKPAPAEGQSKGAAAAAGEKRKAQTSTSASASAAPTASTSSSTGHNASSAASYGLKVGDECQAKYSGDGKFYPARIVSTSGVGQHARFSVIFKGYDNTELISSEDLKPATSVEKKRPSQVTTEEEAEREKKRKKNAKKEATKLQKSEEQKGKQSAWQSFAKKGAKKGIHIPGVQGESMFASPDNPYGKGTFYM